MKFSLLKIFISLILLITINYFNGCTDSSIQTVPGPSSNVTLIGQYNTSGFAQDVFVTTVNSNTLAFVADDNYGFQIINVNSPSQPSLASTYNSDGSAVGIFIATINNIPYAFLSDGNGGLDIVDISNTSSPLLNQTVNFSGDYVTTCFVSGTTAYVGTLNSGMFILDLSTLPLTVNTVSNYNTSDQINDIEIYSGYCYIAETNLGLEIVDVSIPSTPSFLGRFNTFGTGNDVTLNGNIAYVADGSTGITVVDVTTKTNPLFITTVETFGDVNGIFYNSNGLLFTAENNFYTDFSGLESFTTTNPSYPYQYGYYDSYGLGMDVFCFGGYTYLADGSDGLIILQ